MHSVIIQGLSTWRIIWNLLSCYHPAKHIFVEHCRSETTASLCALEWSYKHLGFSFRPPHWLNWPLSTVIMSLCTEPALRFCVGPLMFTDWFYTKVGRGTFGCQHSPLLQKNWSLVASPDECFQHFKTFQKTISLSNDNTTTSIACCKHKLISYLSQHIYEIDEYLSTHWQRQGN